LCCELRFGVRHAYTLGSENEFVDVETFSDIVLEAQGNLGDSTVPAEAEAGTSHALVANDEASPKFVEDLEQTVSRSGGMIQNPSLTETREDIPEEEDPTPSVAAYNETFGTSFRGELLSVGGQVAGANGGSPQFSVLWKSPKFVGATGGHIPKKNFA
jgi:hypothetical protein